MNILQYSKAFVPLLILGALAILANLGIAKDMTVEDAVTLILTGGLVWLVPNKK